MNQFEARSRPEGLPEGRLGVKLLVDLGLVDGRLVTGLVFRNFQ